MRWLLYPKMAVQRAAYVGAVLSVFFVIFAWIPGFAISSGLMFPWCLWSMLEEFESK